MGLSLSTGRLADLRRMDEEAAAWFRAEVAALNDLLVATGCPPHTEPEEAPAVRPRPHVATFPYTHLHRLWRAFARVRRGDPVEPPGPDEDPLDDPAIDEVALSTQTHLLCHSESEGYYVPGDFEDVVFDEGVPGGMVGSSLRLLDELIEVAPALDIRLEDGDLPDAEADLLWREGVDGHPLGVERQTWLALHENARVSILGRTLLVFG